MEPFMELSDRDSRSEKDEIGPRDAFHAVADYYAQN
jgi:hypothetical protein